MKTSLLVGLVLVLVICLGQNQAQAQTMTFDTGISEPGFSFSGFGYDAELDVLYPSAPNVNSQMVITKNSGCWDIASFNPYCWSGNCNPAGGGTWRAFSNKGDEIFFTIPNSPQPIVLNWEKITSFTVKLDDPGTGNPNNTFNFDDVVYSVPSYMSPTTPSATVTNFDTCPGEDVTVNIGGTLNDGTHWKITTGGCGGTQVALVSGNSAVLNPNISTTYTIQGIDECGCAASSACVDFTVDVLTESTEYQGSFGIPSMVTSCPNLELEITATGGIDGSGANTVWYTEPDGAGSIFMFGNPITLTTSSTVTYHVLREGTCNTTDSQPITITFLPDVNAPVINCPADVLFENGVAPCDPVSIVLESAVASDACDVVITNDAPALFPLGNTTVTWTATDLVGNFSTCEQIVNHTCVVPVDYGDICMATAVNALDCDIVTTVAGDNTGAAPSSDTELSCWNSADGIASQHSEWFSVVVPASGTLGITTVASGTLTDSQLKVYSSTDNTCNGFLTEIACHDDVDAINLMAELSLTGLTPGNVLFIEVDGYNGEEGTYGLNVNSCAGCTDPAACNYNPAATFDDGTCDLGLWYLPIDYSSAGEPAILACSPPLGYVLADQNCLESVIAVDDYCIMTDWDQICQNAIILCCSPGCLDIGACNFDSTATCPDLSCTYPGCIDSAACNYDSTAQCDDGTCDFGPWYLPIDYSLAGMPAVQACSTPVGYFLAEEAGCLEQIIANDPYCVDTDWDQTCQNAYLACCAAPGCTDPAACNYDSNATCNDGSCLMICPGCTYSNASNYLAYANLDDGTCIFPGCTDSTYDNYSPLANEDDGTCENNPATSCQTDLNFDGLVNSADLLLFLGQFGTVCP
ncbi:MAG: hypothetical protein ACI84C_001706 [Flavobacteriales bacterium]|jgi:hypothetical protein